MQLLVDSGQPSKGIRLTPENQQYAVKSNIILTPSYIKSEILRIQAKILILDVMEPTDSPNDADMDDIANQVLDDLMFDGDAETLLDDLLFPRPDSLNRPVNGESNSMNDESELQNLLDSIIPFGSENSTINQETEQTAMDTDTTHVEQAVTDPGTETGYPSEMDTFSTDANQAPESETGNLQPAMEIQNAVPLQPLEMPHGFNYNNRNEGDNESRFVSATSIVKRAMRIYLDEITVKYDYKTNKRDHRGELIVDNCIVCLENMVAGEAIRSLHCSHFFHDECITPWLLSRFTCPICRSLISSSRVLPRVLVRGSNDQAAVQFPGPSNTRRNRRRTQGPNLPSLQ